MTDALRVCVVLAMLFAFIAGAALATLAALWIRSGLEDLERMFDL